MEAYKIATVIYFVEPPATAKSYFAYFPIAIRHPFHDSAVCRPINLRILPSAALSRPKVSFRGDTKPHFLDVLPTAILLHHRSTTDLKEFLCTSDDGFRARLWYSVVDLNQPSSDYKSPTLTFVLTEYVGGTIVVPTPF